MEAIHIEDINGIKIAEIVLDGYFINNGQDALELIMNCSYKGADKLILHESQLCAAFFDLKTMIAGEILQKFSQYKMPLAVIGDFDKYASKSLKDFIYESNKTGYIRFVSTKEEALNQSLKKH